LCGSAQIKLHTDSLENSIFIFNENNNHWLTISNLNCNNIWKVYDSLIYPKESKIKFYKDILSDEERVLVSFENVQRQILGNDCGLFSLTFATPFVIEMFHLYCFMIRNLYVIIMLNVLKIIKSNHFLQNLREEALEMLLN